MHYLAMPAAAVNPIPHTLTHTGLTHARPSQQRAVERVWLHSVHIHMSTRYAHAAAIHTHYQSRTIPYRPSCTRNRSHIHTPPITPQGATVFRAADAKRHETTNRSAGAASSLRCKIHKRRYSTTKQQDGATAAGKQSRNETASSCLATAGQRMGAPQRFNKSCGANKKQQQKREEGAPNGQHQSAAVEDTTRQQELHKNCSGEGACQEGRLRTQYAQSYPSPTTNSYRADFAMQTAQSPKSKSRAMF